MNGRVIVELRERQRRAWEARRREVALRRLDVEGEAERETIGGRAILAVGRTGDIETDSRLRELIAGEGFGECGPF